MTALLGDINRFDDLSAKLDLAIDEALGAQRIVGAVVMVARNGKLAYSRAAGFSDREEGRPMRADAVFRLASITKPIVSVAAMRLVEQGKLALEDRVTRWLPNFRPQLPDGAAPEITIRQLLTHTSGLSYRFLEPVDSPYHQLDISDGMDQPGLSLEENLRRLADAPLLFAPGSGWRYSLGLDVLGGVMQQATDRPLPDIVHELVTGPLELQDTGFLVHDRDRLVTAYADGSPAPIRMADTTSVPVYDGAVMLSPERILDAASYPSGGAGMVGTAQDVLRFLEAVRTKNIPNVSPSTVSSMMEAHVGQAAETQGPGWGFGIGWAVLADAMLAGTPQNTGTLQWGGAYGHSWFVDAAREITAVALTNTAVEGMSGSFPCAIRDAIYSA